MLNFDILDNIDPASPTDFFLRALEEFEARWQVTLTVHDQRGLLYGPDGRALLRGRDHHGHLLCEFQRYSRKEWDRNCLRECGFLTESEALHRLRPFRQRCWKGIAELVVPVERNHQAVLLFYAGLAFSYYAVFPAAVLFFMGFATASLQPMFSLSSYLSFFIAFMLPFGVVFELPLVLFFLAKMGLITSAFLKSKRRVLIVVAFIFAAVVSPTTDIFTQVMIAVPMIVLYEASILLVWFILRK